MSDSSGGNLPPLDWGSALRQLPGLIAVVRPDGHIVAAAGRVVTESGQGATQAQDLVLNADRERLGAALHFSASEGRPVRLQVGARAGEGSYLVEVSPGPSGGLLMVWVGAGSERKPSDDVDHDEIETPLGPDRVVASARSGRPTLPTAPGPQAPPKPPTPIPAPATTHTPVPTAPRGATSTLPLDYVLVAPEGLRRVVGRVQRTIDLITPHSVFWAAEGFDGKAVKLAGHPRVLFIGPSKYAEFLRGIIPAQYQAAGANWGIRERQALFWVDETGNEDELRKLIDKAFGKAGKAPVTLPMGATRPFPSGKELAAKFLNESTPHRPGVIEQRYLLAIAMFFLEGFSTFHPAPIVPGAKVEKKKRR